VVVEKGRGDAGLRSHLLDAEPANASLCDHVGSSFKDRLAPLAR
jgi:hypothetical protein